jgi:copper chaperone CopZ
VLDQGTVEVSYDASKVKKAELKNTIEDQGYDVA